jgi:hypothetical protein
MRAWMLNMWAFALGLWIAPRKIFRAFVRGRYTRTLYHEPFDDSMLDETLGATRSRLGLKNRPPRATALDVVHFIFWLGASSPASLIPIAPLILIAAIALILRW